MNMHDWWLEIQRQNEVLNRSDEHRVVFTVDMVRKMVYTTWQQAQKNLLRKASTQGERGFPDFMRDLMQ